MEYEYWKADRSIVCTKKKRKEKSDVFVVCCTAVSIKRKDGRVILLFCCKVLVQYPSFSLRASRPLQAALPHPRNSVKVVSSLPLSINTCKVSFMCSNNALKEGKVQYH